MRVNVRSLLESAIKAVVPYRVYAPIQDALRYLSSFRYLGSRYHCPFCNVRFARFLPDGFDLGVLEEKQVVGAGYRLNSKCPRCFSKDRERLLYLFLKHKKPQVFERRMALLHVAPEKNLARFLRALPNVEYLSADLDSPIAGEVMDVTDLPLADDAYDVILCCHVLEHVEDDGAAMRELFRVLKPGGFAILQVPISYAQAATREDPSITGPREREAAFGQSDHVRIYGPDYFRRLESAGFRVTVHDPAQDFDPRDVTRYALLTGEKVFECAKE